MSYIAFMIVMFLILMIVGVSTILDSIGIDVIGKIEKEMAKFGSYLEKR